MNEFLENIRSTGKSVVTDFENGIFFDDHYNKFKTSKRIALAYTDRAFAILLNSTPDNLPDKKLLDVIKNEVSTSNTKSFFSDFGYNIDNDNKLIIGNLIKGQLDLKVLSSFGIVYNDSSKGFSSQLINVKELKNIEMDNNSLEKSIQGMIKNLVKSTTNHFNKLYNLEIESTYKVNIDSGRFPEIATDLIGIPLRIYALWQKPPLKD